MRRLRTRDGRRAAGAFIAEGPQSVREAVVGDTEVLTLYVSPIGRARFPEIVELAASRGTAIVEATDEVVDAMSETATTQGLVAACALPHADASAVLVPGRVSVYLEGVGDPGNVGTIIRTADAVGAAGVVTGPGTADPFNGKCVRSTAGSIFHLPVAVDVELEVLRAQATTAGLTLAVATGDGEVDLVTWAASAPVGVCWLLGNEAHGVSATARALADVRVRIPMAGRAESLNVATAAAICLFADQFYRHGRMAAP